jgi:hypothetical protein
MHTLKASVRVQIASSLVLAIAALTRPAAADTIGLHLLSTHIPDNNYNNGNLGAYYLLDSGWTAGYYRNSINRDSYYAGYTAHWHFIDITMGAVSGYQDTIYPLVIPTIAFPRVAGFRLRMAYIPPVEKRISSHVLHLMAEYQF